MAQDNQPKERHKGNKGNPVMFRDDPKGQTLDGSPQRNVLLEQALVSNVRHVVSQGRLWMAAQQGALDQIGHGQSDQRRLTRHIKDHFREHGRDILAAPKPHGIQMIVNEFLRHALVEGTVQQKGGVAFVIRCDDCRSWSVGLWLWLLCLGKGQKGRWLLWLQFDFHS